MTLRPLTSKPRKRSFLTYDLEWEPHTLKLRLIGVYDGNARKKYRSYRDVPSFLNAELTRQNRNRWFYAHAGGLYDLRFILWWLADNPKPWIKVEANFSGSSAIIVKITKGRYSWYFVDSYWLLRQPLRKIGKWMKLEKGGDGDQRERTCKVGQIIRDERGDPIVEDGRPKRVPLSECTCDRIFFAPDAELRTYNERDCEILWKAIAYFEQVIGGLGGQLEKTVASSALGLFRRRFLSQTIETSEEVNEAARAAYVASRVEVLRRRCDAGDYYDINSSFPHAMTFEAPGNLAYQARGKLPTRAIYLAEATVRVPDVELPPIPYRSERGRIYFPRGQWSGWFSNVDLELLQETGGDVLKIGRVLVFEPFDDLSDYAETIYEMRRKSDDEAFKVILKILLNSLYGKFAESPIKSRLLLNPESTECPHKHEDGTPMHPSDGVPGSCFEFLTSGIYTHTDVKKVAHAHVPISVHITALARKALFNFMRESYDRGGEVYYCDTDGFAVPPHVTFDTSDQLGGLKHEKRIRQGVFLAPKLYALLQHEPEVAPSDAKWKVRAKGFGGGINYESFCELAERAEDDDWLGLQLPRFERVKEGFKNAGRRDEGFAPVEDWVHKKYRGKMMPKRCFRDDGSSRPWDVREILEREGGWQ